MGHLVKLILQQKERIIFSIIALCGLLFLIGGIKYGIGSLSKPGSGLFPCIIGFIVFLLCSVLAIVPISKTTQAAEEESNSNANVLKIILVIIGIAVYISLLNIVGFLVNTMLLLLFLQKIMGREDWLKPIIIAFIITMSTWMVFNGWLGVELPKGLFNF